MNNFTDILENELQDIYDEKVNLAIDLLDSTRDNTSKVFKIITTILKLMQTKECIVYDNNDTIIEIHHHCINIIRDNEVFISLDINQHDEVNND